MPARNTRDLRVLHASLYRVLNGYVRPVCLVQCRANDSTLAAPAYGSTALVLPGMLCEQMPALALSLRLLIRGISVPMIAPVSALRTKRGFVSSQFRQRNLFIV